MAGVLLLAGCDESHKQPKGPNMSRNISKSYGDKVREKMFERQRERFKELLKTSPIYEKLDEDQNIEISYIKGKVALIDRVTGDYCVSDGNSYIPLIFYYRFYTKSGLPAITFSLKYVPGYPDHFDYIPLRLFDVSESSHQSREVQETRDRISRQRLTQFLASLPEYKGPERPFKMIDAPASQLERDYLQ